MITRPFSGVVVKDGKYILLTTSDKLRDDEVTDWDSVMRQRLALLTHLSNYPPGYSDMIPIPVILEVISYDPPKKVVPQLKQEKRIAAPKQQKGWFHHPKPSKTPSAGITLDWDEGWQPDPQSVVDTNPVCCVACGNGIDSMIDTIRARVFKGFIEKEVEGPIDPTTDLPRIDIVRIPSFDVGRLCQYCKEIMPGVSGRPPKKGEFEYLHERVTPRKKRVVTVGSMKAFEIAEQRRKQTEDKVFVDLGDVKVEHEGDAPEPVDVRSYRAVMRMNKNRGPGRRHDLVDFGERNR